jgi:pantothenate kinase
MTATSPSDAVGGAPETTNPTIISCADLADSPDVAMHKTYDKLAQEAIDTFRATAGERRLWLGVVGSPGSGKSTVAEAVVKRINTMGVKAIAISMDGFHYSQQEMKEKGYDMKRRGASWTFDADRMYKELKNAREKDFGDVYLPEYSREVSDPVAKKIKLEASHDIVVVEGLYLTLGALSQELEDPQSPTNLAVEELGLDNNIGDELKRWEPMLELWDQVFFVEPPFGFRENKRRLIERSLKTWTSAKTETWGGGTDRETATRRVEANDARNAKLVDCCKKYAEFIVQTA